MHRGSWGDYYRDPILSDARRHGDRFEGQTQWKFVGLMCTYLHIYIYIYVYIYVYWHIYEQRISKLCLITWGYINMFQLHVTTRCCISMTIMTTNIYIYIYISIYICIYIWCIWYDTYIYMMHMYCMNVSIDFCTDADQLHPNLISALVCQSRIEETYSILLYSPWFILFTLVYSLYIFSLLEVPLNCPVRTETRTWHRTDAGSVAICWQVVGWNPIPMQRVHVRARLISTFPTRCITFISLSLILCWCRIYPHDAWKLLPLGTSLYKRTPFWWKSMFVFSMHMWITDESAFSKPIGSSTW